MPPGMEATLRDASLYAGLAVLLALAAFAAPAERRRGLAPLAVVSLVALAGLWALGQFGARFDDRTLYEIVREALLALLAIVVARAVLGFVLRVLLARFAVPSIVGDVLLGLALVVYALLRLNATGVNIAGIVTTSAVITGAIAFSAQEVLGALWAGLALQADRTLRHGDWIHVDGKNGQVINIKWRTTTIRTRMNETIIIPNAELIKNRIRVVVRADAAERAVREIPFSVAYAHAPAEVVACLHAALRQDVMPNVAHEPPPECICTSFDDSGIGYKVLYRIVDFARGRETDSEMRARVYAILQRAGMPIPFPQRDVHVVREAAPEEARERAIAERLAAVAGIDLFAALTEDERRALAPAMHPCRYVDGEVLFRKGDAADSLYVLTAGRLRVVDDDPGDAGKTLATLAAPAYVGEMGLLTGQPRMATVLAEGGVAAMRLDKAGFDAILRNRPEVVEALSEALARRQAENDATLRALGLRERAEGDVGRARELVRRIRAFFGLGGGARPK